jgi:GxxExxY protein
MRRRKENNMNENEITTLALDICFKIHKQYGPGLFESVYEEFFCYEWSKTGVPYKRQQGISLVHEAIKMDLGFRADVILDDKVIVEFKSIDATADIHFKQVLTYLKLTNLKLGILTNFNVVLLKDGIKRIANNL